MVADYLWLLTTVGGAILIGGALTYGVLRQRRLRSVEQTAQDRKVRQMYEKRDT